jgi:hypothetical protein
LTNFSEYLSDKGLEGAEELESFLNQIVNNPALFNNLTTEERTDLESQMDAALSLIEKV